MDPYGKENLRKFKKDAREFLDGCALRLSQIAIVLVRRHKDGRKNSEHAKDVGTLAKDSRFGRRSVIHMEFRMNGVTSQVKSAVCVCV